MTRRSDAYQGWSNYETWNLAIWLRRPNTQPCDDTTGLAEQALMDQRATPERQRAIVARELERYVKRQMPVLAAPWRAVVWSGLLAVDWPELADAVLADLREELEQGTREAPEEEPPELCAVCGDTPVYAAESAMCEDCHQESMSENPNDRESARRDRRDA